MSAIQDVRLVTQTGGCARVTALGEDLITGVTKMYSAKLSIPDEGLSYNLDTLRSKKRDTQANYDCGGTFIGLTKGNQQYEEKSFDITFGDDYNFVAATGIDPTVSRSVIKAMFDGTSFTDSNAVGIIGTNGTRNITTSTNTLDHRNLCLEDGKLVDPNLKAISGALSTSANNAVTAYNDTTMIMVEFKYAFGTQVKGDRFCYFLSETCDFNEGGGADYNRYAISGTRYCDPRDIELYMIEGLTDPQAMATSGTDSIYRVDCTHIIHVSGGGTPTVAGGTVGDQIVVVDTDDGTIELYKLDATDWANTPVTSVAGAGCRFFAPLVDTALDGATATTQNAYVVCKTAGATTAAVAVDWFTNTSGTGATTYVLEIRDWSYANAGWINYAGVE